VSVSIRIVTVRFEPLPVRELAGGLSLVRATTPLARLRGLAGLRAIDARVGLELPRCRSVHTLGMRFALDLIWLDGDGAVVRVDRAVPPNRLRSCRRARSVVELAAGHADAFLAAGI
jgi:uncharacterized membrane protein (UPF0127 family)